MSKIEEISWDYVLTSHFYECTDTFTLEQLYQIFKARMIQELKEAKNE